MADDVTVHNGAAGSGTSFDVATDDDGSGNHVQLFKLVYSADGQRTPVGADANGLDVDPRPSVTRIQVSPTTTATIYEAKDAIGGLLTFANAARTSGGSIHIESAVLVDEDSQDDEIDLVLFRASIAAPTDEAAFDPTDAELLDCVGVVTFTADDYAQFTDNSVAYKACAITAKLSGTDLYGVLVARGTPTFASTSSVHVTLTIVQD